MKKFYTKLIALAVSILIISVAIFGVVYFGITGIYVNNYQKGFVYQYRALQNANPDENKIIVIGASYMTFATDSQQLQGLTGMPVYTLGIHSGMGMEYIIETAEKFANPGDVIVFSFYPYIADTYGMDLIYLSLDGETDMFWDFFKSHPVEVFKSAGACVYTKLYGLQSNLRSRDNEISSVYDARAFDSETGNMIYERTECEAEDKDLYCENSLSINDISDECIDEINTLAEYCSGEGIGFYMIYSPFFEGYYNYPSISEMADFQADLHDKLNVTFIADVSDCAMPIEFVYNGALHMNDLGKEYYTNLIFEGMSKYISFTESE